MVFNNLMSKEEIFIDPSGMLSPSYDQWSIEIWIAADGSLYRPSNNIERILQHRDSGTSVVHTIWEEKNFTLRGHLYGARSSVDETVLEVQCFKKTVKPAFLMICIRPYNHLNLGGLQSVQYIGEQKIISINERKVIHIPFKPDFVIAGVNGRDIDIHGQDDTFESRSASGMACMAFGFNLKKGESGIHFRLAMSGGKEISEGNYNIETLKADYASFVAHRLGQSAGLSIADKQFQNWFDASKISTLTATERDYYFRGSEKDGIDYRSLYFIIHGYNRMGYFKEAEGILQFLITAHPIQEKKFTFQHTVQGCYLLCAFTDYFIHLRDIDYLQAEFDHVKKIAHNLYKASSKVRQCPQGNENSIPEFCIREGSPLDIILLSVALGSFSYLARCLGIFGDEIKFKKESERISQLFLDTLSDDAESAWNNFMFYQIYAGYPFRLPLISDAALGKILDGISRLNGGIPLYVRPYGWDILNSLIIAVNLIQKRDIQGYCALKNLLEIGGERYSFPAFMNPVSKRGCYGSGSSKAVSAVLFSTIRQMIFIDYPERLELFPVPLKDWFAAGTEMVVKNAPSRFGYINFRIISTAHEIQIYFEILPKYVPHDILIHLPVKVKIIEGDDYIIKKEEEQQSFIINGWPSVVRFIRK